MRPFSGAVFIQYHFVQFNQLIENEEKKKTSSKKKARRTEKINFVCISVCDEKSKMFFFDKKK